MRYSIVFFITVGLILMSEGAYASEAGEKSGVKTEHTEHPPHDHHNNDHLKKLDEALRLKRKRKLLGNTL